MDFDADVISATGAVMSLAEACRPNAPNIALYFSSSESAPCKAFSPLLARALVAPDGCLCDTDVLLVSSDVTEEAFHASREGFMALPFPASAAREALIDKYNIQAVPMLVIVRRSDGAVVSSTAREAVEACGGVRPVGASPSWRATTTVAWYFVFLSMLAAAMLVSPIGDAVPFMRGSMPSHHLVEKRLFSDDLVGSALDGKLVIVTGANSGVGLGTSRMLAKHNASVVLACRDVRKCEAVRAALPYMARHACLRLDLASLQDVKRFAGEVRARFPKVHGVVLNAGVMFPEFGLTVDGLETTWGVDYVAHVLLTLELAPMLRNGSTVVSVSSNGHFFPSFDPHVGHPERFNDPEVFSRLMQCA